MRAASLGGRAGVCISIHMTMGGQRPLRHMQSMPNLSIPIDRTKGLFMPDSRYCIGRLSVGYSACFRLHHCSKEFK